MLSLLFAYHLHPKVQHLVTRRPDNALSSFIIVARLAIIVLDFLKKMAPPPKTFLA